MEIRKLTLTDKMQLDCLINEVENTLVNKTYWLPITETSREHFFDDEWTFFLGAFENGKLVGAVGLFFNENEYGESKRVLGLCSKDVAEYGRAMVSPLYRNKGVMKELSQRLLQYASKFGKKYIIATVHPDNTPSQQVIKSLGFKKKAFVTKLDIYDRDIMLLEVHNEE